MAVSDTARKNHDELFPGHVSTLAVTDPELIEVWLITGVSSGFGRELATQLLGRGDTVVGTVRRPDSVADLLQKHRARSSASCST